MITAMETITKRQQRDIRLLTRFVSLYCAGRHGTVCRDEIRLPAAAGPLLLCSECARMMTYAVSKRLACPLEGEKPSCKRCRIHCYGEQERRKIREIMSFAGRRVILLGRLDYLWQYLF